jgi:hypothetical protein
VFEELGDQARAFDALKRAMNVQQAQRRLP